MQTNVTLPDETLGVGPSERALAATEKPIHVDSAEKNQDKSPFQKARSLDKRLKLFLWGDSGVGKTTLALQFPSPVVIDMEGGADLYGDAFEYGVMRTTTADEAMKAVDWLLAHEHDYRTLVIDPITVYWDALQKKWSDIFLRRNTKSKGYRFEFYDLQPRDWMTIKAEFKDFLRKIIALDMNVIVTARQKVQYADGALMRAVGNTFDGEKSLPYLFDTVARLYRDEKGRFLCECLKDRSNKLKPGEFECSFARFEELIGKEALTREAKPVILATDAQKRKIRTHLARFDATQEQVAQRLAAYGAESIDDLTENNAQIVIAKLESALANWDEATNHERKE